MSYSTIQCVDDGRRMIVGIEHITKDKKMTDLVRSLLEEAFSHGIRIKRLLLDRGYFSIAVINLLNEMGITFIMPARKTNSIKRRIRAYAKGEGGKIMEHTIKSGKNTASFHLIIMKKASAKEDGDEQEDSEQEEIDADDDEDAITKDYVVFATNIPQSEIIEEISLIPEEYRKRWGIETGFRCLKGIMGKTTSRSMSFRIFLFFFSAVLFNMWVMRGYRSQRAGAGHVKLVIFVTRCVLLNLREMGISVVKEPPRKGPPPRGQN